eukprot:2459975-Rhodomonas_salina.3
MQPRPLSSAGHCSLAKRKPLTRPGIPFRDTADPRARAVRRVQLELYGPSTAAKSKTRQDTLGTKCTRDACACL